MSEYWKSTPKYWCKHCAAYVKDTPFERKQHESTAKHQSGLKRFLRDIQNGHERGERDKQRAKSEVERLKGVAGLATQDSGSSLSSKPASTVSKPGPAPPSVADRKRQWTQLAEMGIKVPEGYWPEMAMPGDWQTTPHRPVKEPLAEAPLSRGVRERRYEGQEDDEEEKRVAGESVIRRGWGASLKTYPGRDSDDLDDLLSASRLVKEKTKPSSPTPQLVTTLRETKEQTPLHHHGMIKEEVDPLVKYEPQSDDHNGLKLKDDADIAQKAELVDQIAPSDVMPVFKKRKVKAR